MTTATVEPAEQYKEPDTLPDILATTITAALATFGVLIAIASGYGMWVMPWAWKLPALGGVLFGALLAIRFTRDDRGVALRVATLSLDLEDALEEIERLELRVDAAEGSLRVAKVEVDRLTLLRNAGDKYVMPESIIDPVHEDAVKLIGEWTRRDYLPPTQRYMQDIAGWSPQRYGKALTYLGAREVVDKNATKPLWLVDNQADAMRLVGAID